jgi:hypothetical protein
MSDRASASIIIGGSIPRSIIPRLVRAIEEDHGLQDWDGEPVDDSSIISGRGLEVYAFELPGGIFVNVESLCLANKMPLYDPLEADPVFLGRRGSYLIARSALNTTTSMRATKLFSRGARRSNSEALAPFGRGSLRPTLRRRRSRS